MGSYMSNLKQRRKNGERGAALLEFAIAVPIFIGLLLLVFDAGLGYSASRTSSSTARTAARAGALAGAERDADFLILDAIRAQYGASGEDGEQGAISRIVVYKSEPTNTNGAPPPGCITGSIANVCNSYSAAILNSLTPETFAGLDALGNPTCAGAPDEAWCPLDRRADEDSFLGVYISSVYETTTGLGTSDADPDDPDDPDDQTGVFDLEDRAVFAFYFAPEPTDAAVGP